MLISFFIFVEIHVFVLLTSYMEWRNIRLHCREAYSKVVCFSIDITNSALISTLVFKRNILRLSLVLKIVWVRISTCHWIYRTHLLSTVNVIDCFVSRLVDYVSSFLSELKMGILYYEIDFPAIFSVNEKQTFRNLN